MKEYLSSRESGKHGAARRRLHTYEKILSHSLDDTLRDPVLDAGAGSGDFVEVLQDEGFEARGIDFNTVDFETDPFPMEDNTFGCVSANAVIEHLSEPENFLREIMRVLRPGGWFIVTTPNWRKSYRSFYKDPTHRQPYDPNSLKKILEMFGFEVPFLNPHFIGKPLWLFKLPFKWHLTFITRSMMAMARLPH